MKSPDTPGGVSLRVTLRISYILYLKKCGVLLSENPGSYLAAAAAVVVIAATAQAIGAAVAAAGEEQDQNDDPPAAISTKKIVVAHKTLPPRLICYGLRRTFHVIPKGKKGASRSRNRSLQIFSPPPLSWGFPFPVG